MTFDFDEIQVSDCVALAQVRPMLGLWAAVITSAVDDVHYGLKRGWSMENCPGNSTSNDFRTAWLWLHDWDDGEPGSFSWACDLFDFDPVRVRSKAMTNSCRLEIAKYTKRPPIATVPCADQIPNHTFMAADLMTTGRARTTVYKMIREWVAAGAIEPIENNPKRYRPCTSPLSTSSATFAASPEASTITTTPAPKSGKRSTRTTSDPASTSGQRKSTPAPGCLVSS